MVPASTDLLVEEDALFEGAEIPEPENCTTDPMCRSDPVRFYMPDPVDGLTLLGSDDETFLGADSRPDLQVDAGSSFRARPVLFTVHPSFCVENDEWFWCNDVAVVIVLPPCTAPCDIDEERCPYDNACYEQGEKYCLRCLPYHQDCCACMIPEGVAEDGADCDYYVGADMMSSGTCLDGICEPD
jgi:hypothetical protein